jgi:hypothetical protein
MPLWTNWIILYHTISINGTKMWWSHTQVSPVETLNYNCMKPPVNDFLNYNMFLACSIQLCYPYNCLYTLGPKKNMWVSGFPTLPSFWTPKSRHSIGRQPVGPLRGEKSGNYLSYVPGGLRSQNQYSVIQFYSELLPFTGCRYVN